MSQQQAMQDPAVLHNTNPNMPMKSTRVPVTSQSLLLREYPPQHQQPQASPPPSSSSSAAAAAGAESSMLYNKCGIDPAPAALPSHEPLDRSVTRADIADYYTQSQHMRDPLQQQHLVHRAQEQQMPSAPQPQHQQQLQQAVLVDSVEASAGSLASSHSLYGTHCTSTHQNYKIPATNHRDGNQQQLGMPAVLPGLSQCSTATSCLADSSHRSAGSIASSSATAAHLAVINSYMQQRVSFEVHKNFSGIAGTSAVADNGNMQQAAPADRGRPLTDARTAALGLMCDENLLPVDAEQQQQSGTAAAAAALATVTGPRVFSGWIRSASGISVGAVDDVNMEVQNHPAALRSFKPNYMPDPNTATTAPALASAQAAADKASAARHSMALQLVTSTADMRKQAPVLTASDTAGRAAAAGAVSVRSRLLISEVLVYTERGANSVMALDQANKLLSKMTLPDGITYMPIPPESFLFKAAAAWQFPAFVICLGSSYLQRMCARLPQLAEAVMACPGFEDYCRYLPQRDYRMVPHQLSGPEAAATLATLRSVQFTCLYLATKAVDQIHALGLLRFMLSKMSHNGAAVTLQQAVDVEARCLDALDWRLGPWFTEDDLSGDHAVPWAGSMGHWDYEGDIDRHPKPHA